MPHIKRGMNVLIECSARAKPAVMQPSSSEPPSETTAAASVVAAAEQLFYFFGLRASACDDIHIITNRECARE